MRRKIIVQGNASYTLTLPVRWVREEHVDVTREVEVAQEERRIIISAPQHAFVPKSSIAQHLHDYDARTIRNVLNTLYRKGYDELQLQFDAPKMCEIIKRIVRETLPGFEVVEEHPHACIIQNIAEPSEENFDVILRRLFLIIRQDVRAIHESMASGTDTLAARQETKNMVDTYTNLCRRLIIRNRISGRRTSYMLFMFVSRLSLLAHAYFYLYVSHERGALSPETLQFLQEAADLLDALYDAYYARSAQQAHAISTRKDALFATQLYPLLRAGRDGVSVYHIGEAVRLTHLLSILLFGFLAEDAPAVSRTAPPRGVAP